MAFSLIPVSDIDLFEGVQQIDPDWLGKSAHRAKLHLNDFVNCSVSTRY